MYSPRPAAEAKHATACLATRRRECTQDQLSRHLTFHRFSPCGGELSPTTGQSALTRMRSCKEIDRAERDCVVSSEAGNSPATGTRTSPWAYAAERIRHWHNWKIPIKFAAVVLVPVVLACGLGFLHIRGQIRQADAYTHLGKVISSAEAVRTSATLLQEERTRTAELLVDDTTTPEAVEEQFAATDAAWDHATRALRAHSENGAGTDVVVGMAQDEVERKFAEIAGLREQVLNGRIDPMNAINSYTDIVRSVLALDRTLIGQISSARLAPTATSLHELAKISHEVRLQEVLVLTGLHRGSFPPETLTQLGESETRRASAIDEFRAAATPHQRFDYDNLYFQPDVSARETSLRTVLSTQGGTSAGLSLAEWESVSQAELGALDGLETHMEAHLRDTTEGLHDNASNTAGLGSVLLLSAMLVAGLIVVVVAHQLLGSLAALRRSALDAANRQLPRAVAEIRSGSTTRTPPKVEIETNEEVGQVARAFDNVQTQAVNLAAEQAELRKSYSDSFVNVSRRSQSLLERQLRLFEQLERDEQDPDQLATLFQLDHLATRMRRNNENLMVLAGTDLTRRFTRPASPADLIRAAVSEIEHYPRVIVHPLPRTRIVGYVANDLVRLFAELLDNAANFSAPHTNVTVNGQLSKDGTFEFDIVDSGIGMDDVELEAANDSLNDDREIDVSVSRRMGLFVVGRLASRHRIAVRLEHGADGLGTRAAVSLPQELLLHGSTKHAPAPAQAESSPDFAPDASALVGSYNWSTAESEAATLDNLSPVSSASSRNGAHQQHDHSNGIAHPSTNGKAAGLSTESDINGVHRNSVSPRPPLGDDLASAWFRATATPEADHDPTDTAAEGTSKGTSLSDVGEKFPCSQEHPESSDHSADWTSPLDQFRQRAEQVSEPKPDAFTSAGLPIRTPQEHLIAGNAGFEEAEPSQPSRRPGDSRRRLASFQDGLRKGRGENAQHETSEEERTAEATAHNGQSTSTGTAPESAEMDGTDFHYTSKGLPRRTPRAHLAQGEVTRPETASTTVTRDADTVRGRLERFQQGVQEGKHALREQQ